MYYVLIRIVNREQGCRENVHLFRKPLLLAFCSMLVHNFLVNLSTKPIKPLKKSIFVGLLRSLLVLCFGRARLKKGSKHENLYSTHYG